MKYDKVRVDQMVGNNPNAQQNMCNQVLTAFDALATYPIDSPLQNYHNVMQCIVGIADISRQAMAAALNQLRVEKPELFKAVSYNFAREERDKEMAEQPIIEYEGCKFRVGVFPDFTNLVRKDEKLSTYVKNEKEINKQGMKIYKYFIDRVRELLKQKEYKKAKPRKVDESLYFEDINWVQQ